MSEHDPIVRTCKEPDLFAPDVDPWADLEQAESDLADRDVRIAELESEVKRVREALKHIASMAAQDMMLDDYGLHTNQIVLVAHTALKPQP